MLGPCSLAACQPQPIDPPQPSMTMVSREEYPGTAILNGVEHAVTIELVSACAEPACELHLLVEFFPVVGGGRFVLLRDGRGSSRLENPETSVRSTHLAISDDLHGQGVRELFDGGPLIVWEQDGPATVACWNGSADDVVTDGARSIVPLEGPPFELDCAGAGLRRAPGHRARDGRLGQAPGMRLASLLLLLVPSIASADVIGGGPTSCPPGSELSFCHGPAVCALATCASDAECDADQVCAPVSLCVGSDYCGGGWGGGGGPVEVGIAPCSGEVACPADSSCRSLRACVVGTRADAGPAGPSHHVYGCSCAASGRGAPSLLAIVSSLVLVVLRRRRVR